MNRKILTAGGVSLLEIIVALAIFSVAILATFTIINLEWNTIRDTQEKIYVTRILNSRIEELRDLQYDDLDALSAQITFTPKPAITVFNEAINPVAVDTTFERELKEATGTVFIDEIETDLKKITVRVDWKSAGSEREVSLSSVTYITRNGVNRL